MISKSSIFNIYHCEQIANSSLQQPDYLQQEFKLFTMKRTYSKKKQRSMQDEIKDVIDIEVDNSLIGNQFTKFCVAVKNMTSQNQMQEEQSLPEFKKFKVCVKSYFQQQPTTFDEFRIRIPEFKESCQEPESNSLSEKNQFIEFTKIRYKNCNSQQVDLKVCDLKEIVFFLFKEQLMSDPIFRKFQMNYKEKEELKFIQLHQIHQQASKKQVKRKYQTDSRIFDLEEKNFLKKTLFALIDYRIFSEILMVWYPHKYHMTEFPRCFLFQSNQYLQTIYQMNFEEYLEQFDSFNERFGRIWMPKGSYLMSNYKYFSQVLQNRCPKSLKQIFVGWKGQNLEL